MADHAYVSQTVAVCLLQLLLLSIPHPIKPFSLTKIAANGFLKEESSAIFLHKHDDDDVSDATSSRALQFNMTNLIRPDKDARRQNEKLIHLSSINFVQGFENRFGCTESIGCSLSRRWRKDERIKQKYLSMKRRHHGHNST
jgi:hypothetical protein